MKLYIVLVLGMCTLPRETKVGGHMLVSKEGSLKASQGV
jgi:hypothetical protein